MSRHDTRPAPRFFVSADLRIGGQMDMTASVIRHMQALRMQEGDPVILFDGRGGEHQARLLQLGKKSARVQIGAHVQVERESALETVLAQCLPSGDKMDLVLQKATELGVCRIQPLQAERSVMRLSGERLERRMAHWQGVIGSACEQCGRNTIPVLEPLAGLFPWLSALDAPDTDERRLMLAPDAARGLVETNVGRRVVLLIGAEGGLAAHEVEAAHRAGFRATRLGPRILRTETAPLAALAAIQVLWGDMR